MLAAVPVLLLAACAVDVPRTTLIAGNWKLNPATAQEAATLIQGVADGYSHLRALHPARAPELAVFPPHPFIHIAAAHGVQAGIHVGAQNIGAEPSVGAFTGEVSAPMVASLGVAYVILGHSERRHIYGETDDLINRKVHVALEAGLRVILCVGETEAEYLAGDQDAVTVRQLSRGLKGLAVEHLANVTIAYEPVWAVGTGRTATGEQAQRSHARIRAALELAFGETSASAMRILYGGSVTPETAGPLLRMPDVDGALVGGASLSPSKFAAIAAVAAGLLGDTASPVSVVASESAPLLPAGDTGHEGHGPSGCDRIGIAIGPEASSAAATTEFVRLR